MDLFLPGFVGDERARRLWVRYTGNRHRVDEDRILATVLFTDIVDSTRRASEVGDRRWRELMDAHDEMSAREVERFTRSPPESSRERNRRHNSWSVSSASDACEHMHLGLPAIGGFESSRASRCAAAAAARSGSTLPEHRRH